VEQEVAVEKGVQLIIDQVLPALALDSGILNASEVLAFLQDVKCLRDTEVMQSKIWNQRCGKLQQRLVLTGRQPEVLGDTEQGIHQEVIGILDGGLDSL
jgi:hypothetical protein